MRGIWQMTGLDEYLTKIQQAGRDVDQAAAECVQVAGEMLHHEMVDNIPVGSLREDPEAGALRNFVQQQGLGPITRAGNVTTVEVGLRSFGPSTMPSPAARTAYGRTHRRAARHWAGRFYYGIYLEFGTRKMAARPWFRPSIDAMRGPIKARWRQIFKRWGLIE